ncbi:MAG: ATP-binding protein [Candidatus Zixiibacteriota bacterium]
MVLKGIINILIVDDSKEMLTVLKDSLEGSMRRIKTVKNGSEFNELDLDEESFDVAIIDMKLPDITPEEIIKKLHENEPNIQIIIITGNPSESNVITFLRKGVFDYIRKPVKIDFLEDRVLKAAEKKLLLDENELYMVQLARQNKQLQMQGHRLETLLGDTAKELVQTTEYLKTTVRNLPEGIILMDREYRIKIANINAVELLGLPHDYREKSCLDIYGTTELWPYFRKKLQTPVLEKPLNVIEILPNDRIVLFEIVPIQIDGDVENYLAILKDITMEHRHKSWLEAVMNTLVDGITIIDRDRTIIWMNQVSARWSEEHNTGVGNKCHSWFHCSSSPHPQCPAEQTFRDGKIHRTTLREMTRDGEERFYDVITGAISPTRGKVHQVVEIRRDVTQRARMITDLQNAMENLEKLNRKLNEKIEQLSIIAQITDTLQSTNNLNEILHIILTAVTAEQGLGFNRAFLLLLDSEKQYLVGKYAIGPSDPEEAGRIWSELSRSRGTLHEVLGSYRLITAEKNLLAKRVVSGFNIPIYKEDNILIDSLLNHKTYNFTDKPPDRDVSYVAELLDSNRFAVVPVHTMTDNLGVLIVDNKITNAPITHNQLEFLKLITSHASLAIERSYLGFQLQEKYSELGDMYNRLRVNQKKLIRAEKLSIVGQMAAQLAHEIKNPLVSIGGFARNLLKNQDEMDNATLKKLEIIRDETSRIERIVTDLLNFARIQEPHFSNVNINMIIRKAAEIVQVQLEQKELNIELNLEEDVPEIQIDSEQIHQVLLNLLTNSISATPQGGQIRVESRTDDDHLWIEVSDTGPGIDTEYQERIFEPFFTTKSAGTGLGLAISSQIIKKHHGTIWFTSTPEKGTVFHIKLPLKHIRSDEDAKDTTG